MPHLGDGEDPQFNRAKLKCIDRTYESRQLREHLLMESFCIQSVLQICAVFEFFFFLQGKKTPLHISAPAVHFQLLLIMWMYNLIPTEYI